MYLKISMFNSVKFECNNTCIRISVCHGTLMYVSLFEVSWSCLQW